MSRPNLILIHTHDTGRHLGCYGAPVPTPQLNRFAKEGVLFRKAYCTSPCCSPSRVSLMTGLMPHNSGMIGLAHNGFKMKNPGMHLANLLRQSGYRTQLIGFQHECSKTEEDILGYDEILPKELFGFHSIHRAKRAAEWLTQPPKKPFFLNIGFSETHRNFLPFEPPDDPRYLAPFPWLPDSPEIRRDMADFHTAVRHVDEAVGIILDAIDRSGLKENTLVIFTTDHGVPFPRAKATLLDAGTGVALLMRGPAGFHNGKVMDTMVTHMDLLPTFFEIADIKIPKYTQGKSLVSLVNDQAKSVHDEIFGELNFHASYDPARSIRTERFKYIRFFEERQRAVLPNVDDSYSKEYLVDYDWPIGKRPSELLYDLVADPQEFENVADWPECASVRNQLQERLENWMKSSDDPLLQGPLTPPEGAKVIPWNDYHQGGGSRKVEEVS